MSFHAVVTDPNANNPSGYPLASLIHAPTLLGLLNASAGLPDPEAAVDVIAAIIMNQPPPLFPMIVPNYRTAALFTEPVQPGRILVRFMVIPYEGHIEGSQISHFLVAFYTAIESAFPGATVAELRLGRFDDRAAGYAICSGNFPNISHVIHTGGLNVTNKFARGTWSNAMEESIPVRDSIQECMKICRTLKSL